MEFFIWVGFVYDLTYCTLILAHFWVDTIRDLLSVDVESWKADCENIKAFYEQIGDRVPAELREELNALVARLG